MVELSRKFADRIYYNSSNVDVKINENEIREFISENHDELEFLAIQHLKKISQHKEFQFR